MPINNILRNINLFVDGQGFMGRVDEFELPKLTIKTEEFRAGGMDGTVELDMGQEKMEATLTMSGIDRELVKLWGIYTSASTPPDRPRRSPGRGRNHHSGRSPPSR